MTHEVTDMTHDEIVAHVVTMRRQVSQLQVTILEVMKRVMAMYEGMQAAVEGRTIDEIDDCLNPKAEKGN